MIGENYRALHTQGAFEGHERCLTYNRGYVTKFNEGIVNSTKIFHGTTSNMVVDVPAIKMSKCYDFCGDVHYTDYIAALVRFTDQNMLVIMDGHMLDIKAMWYLEKEWVSTHRMNHYQNIVWNQAASGSSWELDKYRLYTGLTR